jgi:hypothetical protein
MENKGQIIRSKKTGKSRYTAISNEIIQSKTLTIEERGVLIYLLSLPEDWVIYKYNIWKQMNIGRDKFFKIWVNLVKYGYITTIKIFRENSNLIAGYVHTVYEEPFCVESDNMEIGLTKNQVVREPVAIQSTNLQSNNLQNNKIENNISTNIEHLGKSSPVDKFREILNK